MLKHVVILGLAVAAIAAPAMAIAQTPPPPPPSVVITVEITQTEATVLKPDMKKAPELNNVIQVRELKALDEKTIVPVSIVFKNLSGQPLNVEVPITTRRPDSGLSTVFTEVCPPSSGACSIISLPDATPKTIALSDLLSVTHGDEITLGFKGTRLPLTIKPITLGAYATAPNTAKPVIIEIDGEGIAPITGELTGSDHTVRPIVVRNQLRKNISVILDLRFDALPPSRSNVTTSRVRCAENERPCLKLDLPGQGEYLILPPITLQHDKLTVLADDAGGPLAQGSQLVIEPKSTPAPNGSVVATVDLTTLGVPLRYRNPRSPEDLSKSSNASDVMVFHNTTLDRDFVISVPIAEPRKADAAARASTYHFKLDACSGRTCAVIRLAAGTQLSLPVELLRDPAATADPLVKFTVAQTYSLDDGPTYKVGYLKVGTQPSKPRNSKSASGTLGFSGNRSSALDTWLPATANSYDGSAIYAGSGSLAVTPQIDNGWVHLQATGVGKGVAGAGVTTPTFSVSEISATLYGSKGLSITAGRTAVFDPASGVGFSLSGDSVKFTMPAGVLQSVSLAGVLVRESATGKPDVSNGDNRIAAISVGPFGSKKTGVLESVRFDAIYGEDLTKQYRYWTAGATAHLSNSQGVMSGTTAVFMSGRKATGSGTIEEGRGLAYLTVLDFGVQRDEKTRSVNRVLRFSVVGGSGDNPDSARDEGYTGERMSYGGAKGVFLGALAPKFGTTDRPVGTNLRNTNVFGVEFVDRNWSPLELLLAVAHIGPEERSGANMTVTFQTYRRNRLTSEDMRRGLGSEVILSTKITGPKNVEWSLSMSRYFPSGDTDKTFKVLPIQLASSVVLRFQ